MADLKNIFFLILLLAPAALGLWGCGEPELDKIDVYPASEELLAGEISIFKARMLSDKGDEMPGLEFKWSIDSDIGTIDQSGRFKAEKEGQGIITASSGKITGTARIEVKAALTEEDTGEAGAAETGLDDAGALVNVIAIYSGTFTAHEKVPVILSHKKHIVEYNVACVECHHDYQDGENVWVPTDPVKPCESCHLLEETEEGVKKIQTAYHNNCKDCHKERVKAGDSEDAPYIACTGCHKERD